MLCKNKNHLSDELLLVWKVKREKMKAAKILKDSLLIKT